MIPVQGSISKLGVWLYNNQTGRVLNRTMETGKLEFETQHT